MITKVANERGYLSSNEINKTIDDILLYKTAGDWKAYLVSIHIRPPIYEVVNFDEESERRESKEDYDEDMWGSYDDSSMWEENNKYQSIYETAKRKLESKYGYEFLERLPDNYDGQVVVAEEYDSFDEAMADLLLLKKDDLLMARNVDETAYQELDNKYQELTGKSFKEEQEEDEKSSREKDERKKQELLVPQECDCSCVVCEAVENGEQMGNYPVTKFNHCYNKVGQESLPPEARSTGKCYDSIYNHPNIDEFDFNTMANKNTIMVWDDKNWGRWADLFRK